MSTISISGDEFAVRFTTAEKIAGLVRNQRFPVAAVTSVEIVDDPVGETRGLRAPGLGLPGVRKIGTWRRLGAKELVCVRRGEPAVRIELDGQPYEALLIGAPDAAAVAEDLRARVSRG